MPSGAKKRKAAKKKKENPNLSSLPSSAHHQSPPHGSSDDVNHQEDDACQVSSSQNPLTSTGDHEEVIHGEKIATDAPPSKVVDKNAVPIEDEETVKRSYSSRSSSSGGSSSSGSSSDDESHIVKSNQAVEDVAPIVAESSSDMKSETGNNVIIEDAVASEPVVQNVGAVVQMAEVTKDEKINFFEDSAGISTIANDTSASEPTEEVRIHSNEKVATISNPEENLSQITDDHLIVTYNAPVDAPKNGANNVMDPGVAEPMVRADPRPVQTTSWKSCCGLFEVFTGSGRSVEKEGT